MRRLRHGRDVFWIAFAFTSGVRRSYLVDGRALEALIGDAARAQRSDQTRDVVHKVWMRGRDGRGVGAGAANAAHDRLGEGGDGGGGVMTRGIE